MTSALAIVRDSFGANQVDALCGGQAAAALAVTGRGRQSAMRTRAQVLARSGDPVAQGLSQAWRS